MTNPVLETDRLRLVPFTEDDFQNLQSLHSDPEVNRYLSPGPAIMSPEEVRHRLTNYIGDHLHTGISKWKLETLDGDVVGRAGFTWMNDPEGYELGYCLKQAAWGRGYATEITRALIAWFFENTDQDHFLAYAVRENDASLKVMQKAGMGFWLDLDMHGLACRFYRIDRSTYMEQAMAASA
ncbi:GNAT family N-acetyltransferase [Roseibium sediminicola]|uniref:GNAT family N-acetyltransferase n=1 Tax=Roseibium sediminicola TaxID=2933272 RepID=A0ABT0GVN6_9HYPH|nr:GNAT family N-acetyltransferase [Roseibium sp. CAU 1639]MCK7613501.1 GNAT family N-acetyltransferase [Roseibium sp. CAU 1639]